MARRPQIRYFASRQAYYCQWQGKQHLLAKGPDDFPNGPTYAAASKAFGQLWEMAGVDTAHDENTVRVICETHLQRIEGKVTWHTFDVRRRLLAPFVEAHGNLHVSQLTERTLEDFLDTMRQPRKVLGGRLRVGQEDRGRRVLTVTWAESTIATFTQSLHAALNWAADRKLISANPVRTFRPERARSRGRDCILTPEQHAQLLASSKSAGFRTLLIALEATGARPGELVAATAADWDDANGCLLYHQDVRRRKGEFRHKSARKKDRRIFFTGEALEMMRNLVKKYRTGPLFRGLRGTAFKRTALEGFFRSRRELLGMPNLVPYSYRHTFATRWLIAGRSIEVLAELLGNTPDVIRHHYAHLCGDCAGVRKHLEAFKAAGKTDS